MMETQQSVQSTAKKTTVQSSSSSGAAVSAAESIETLSKPLSSGAICEMLKGHPTHPHLSQDSQKGKKRKKSEVK